MPNWKKVIVSGSDAHLKEVSSSGGISLGDDVFLNLGDSSDLQLYHDGSNSYIKIMVQELYFIGLAHRHFKMQLVPKRWLYSTQLIQLI